MIVISLGGGKNNCGRSLAEQFWPHPPTEVALPVSICDASNMYNTVNLSVENGGQKKPACCNLR